MLKHRIISALIGIPLLIGVSYLGGIYWRALLALLAGLAMFEYLDMMRVKKLQPMVLPAYFIMAVLLFRGPFSSYLPVLFGAGLSLMIIAMLAGTESTFDDLVFSFFGAFYIGYTFAFAIDLAVLENSFYYLLLVFILTWASDVGGYLFGMLWGRHKLAPLLSPGKTWEGALGAVLLTITVTMVFNHLIGICSISWRYMLLLGILASVAAQVGDLHESGMKRYFGVKDSGRVIPGHGGVLDRFDSFMLVLPVVYYFLVVFA